jgi:hypothetical protein
MTKRERERVRRAAAVIALGQPPAPTEDGAGVRVTFTSGDDRWEALRCWRGQDGIEPPQPSQRS